MKGKNWFGMSFHRTDEFIHWSTKAATQEAVKLRDAYDAIVMAGLKEELEYLIEAASDATRREIYDGMAGDDL